ncbi:MAG: hypothetical protein L6R41_005914 [Letrouitia leprolyta]|nr:MAG: hypothetical protein L6R41_005914 [Letrouitia leprolyta]
MKEIYASSSETLVWLGPADEMTDTAFIHLGSLSQSWEVRPPHLKRIDILDEDLEEYRNLFHSECVNDDLIQPWRAIQFVACRSWFERAWVMQEVGVARMVIFMCGNRMIPWRTLINTGAVIVQHNSMLNRSIDIESHGRREILEALTRAIRSMQEFSKNSASYRSKTLLRGDDGLITILNQLRSMQATDPRDKAFNEITGYNEAIYCDARWLQEWASFQSEPTNGSSWLIHRNDWQFNPEREDETFEELTYMPTDGRFSEAYRRLLTADTFFDIPNRQAKRTRGAKNPLPMNLTSDEHMSSKYERRAFAVSNQGLIALVPAEARVHDIIALVQGSELPFILRPSEDDFLFIGQAHVHGIMDGELWSHVEDGSMPLREISII